MLSRSHIYIYIAAKNFFNIFCLFFFGGGGAVSRAFSPSLYEALQAQNIVPTAQSILPHPGNKRYNGGSSARGVLGSTPGSWRPHLIKSKFIYSFMYHVTPFGKFSVQWVNLVHWPRPAFCLFQQTCMT